MNKLDLLRRVVANLHRVPATAGQIGIKREGRQAFHDLTNVVFESSTRYLRGTTFERLLGEMLGVVIDSFLGTDPGSIGLPEFRLLEEKINAWFVKEAGSHRIYVPCSITPWPSPLFSIGPVNFSHLDQFSMGEGQSAGPFNETFSRMFEAMRQAGSLWMATVEVEDCIQERSDELGNLAVDIALVGIQLAVPLAGFRAAGMARMAARSYPQFRHSISRTNGQFRGGWERLDPGLGIGPGLLVDLLTPRASLIRGVGNRIASFLGSTSALPGLNLAWSDAAYWFHEAVAEPLDTIAVAKLETTLEVLFAGENPSRGERRLLTAIKGFHSKEPGEPLVTKPDVTVRQFVKGIVRDRSRILHGTWSTLASHLHDSRPHLAALVQSLLGHYAVELDIYASEQGATDDIDASLASVHKRKATP